MFDATRISPPSIGQVDTAPIVVPRSGFWFRRESLTKGSYWESVEVATKCTEEDTRGKGAHLGFVVGKDFVAVWLGGRDQSEAAGQTHGGHTAVRKRGTRDYAAGGAEVLIDLTISIGLETRHART